MRYGLRTLLIFVPLGIISGGGFIAARSASQTWVDESGAIIGPTLLGLAIQAAYGGFWGAIVGLLIGVTKRPARDSRKNELIWYLACVVGSAVLAAVTMPFFLPAAEFFRMIK